jgi:dihydrolipoamide dehydrogenase
MKKSRYIDMDKDLLIIGGGPGGYVAAIRASQLGASVTLIEEDKVGGTCLNRGCISTKALYKNAEVINTIKKSDDFGVSVAEYSVNMGKVQQRKNNISDGLRIGVEQLLKGLNVELIYGKAKFVDNKTVEYLSTDGTKDIISAKKIIIATGSKVSKIPIEGVDLPNVITSNEALNLNYVPNEIVIIGGGVIGVEFAGIFSAFGASVTIVEYASRILPMLDEEMVKRLSIFLKKKNIKINTSNAVKRIEKTDDNKLKLIADNNGKALEYTADLVLMSTGRSINIDGLNLEKTSIEYDSKGIKVNEVYESSVQNIYAIGDVIGGQMLAHLASDEGKVAVENMYGINSSVNYDCVPACVFTFPELSSVGLTEEEAKNRKIDYSVGKFNFAANSKAQTISEADGLIKVLADKETKKLIGVHILGPSASDLIHESALAIQNGLTINDIKDTIHAHPTLSEAFQEASLAVIEEAIHALPRRKL